MTMTLLAAALVLVPALDEAPPPGKVKTDRTIALTVTLDQPPSEVYRLWTSLPGVRTFFAPDARIDPEPGGRYEVITAWDYVLANLAKRFAEGPIDWSKR